jgi:hypothetical protein
VRLPFFCPLVFSCLLLSLSFASAAPAQPTSQDSVALGDALRQLADRFAATSSAHGGLFRVEFFAYAPVAAESSKEWQDFFRQQLESHHFTVTTDPAAPLLRVGVAETPTELVFSAAARVGDKDEVRLLTFPRAAFRPANLPVAPVRLEKQLLYQSTDPLLDASFWNGTSPGIVVLADHNGQLVALHVNPPSSIEQSIMLNAAGPLSSRNLQGELAERQDSASVLLPGKSCDFTWAAPTEATCRALKFTPRGPVVLTPSCGKGAWKLLADGADWTTPEPLQAVPASAMQSRSAVILSDFPGPIISLNGEQNLSPSALVVTRNLRTGIYEVYKVTLACGN